jgi:two-component system response regulator AtoC
LQTQISGRTILVCDEDVEVQTYLEMALKRQGHSVELAQDGDEILGRLGPSSLPMVSIVFLDIDRHGIELLRDIRRLDAHLPVIVLSEAPTPSDIVTAMKSGATDFLCRPVIHENLQMALLKGVERHAALPHLQPVQARPSTNRTFWGESPRMKEIHSLIPHIGRSDTPVLIQGETGSGKEILARELHANSARAGKVFLKLNCAALPSELVESELFGYERGAFTGAFQRRAGMFEMANGGTLLLDEIGDMDFRLQAKLLQVLQDSEFQRIGGKEVIRVDVRVLAATHRDLENAILDRSFREDLYYRLNVINIELPPLRDRKEDILPLTEYLLKKHSVPGSFVPAITPNLRHALLTHQWPGNIRELENTVRRLIVLRNPDLAASELLMRASRQRLPAPTHGRASVAPEVPQAAVSGAPKAPILELVTKAKQQAEADAILAALESTRWNRKQAAVLLQIDYKALLYKLKKLGLDDKATPLDAFQEPYVRPANREVNESFG